MGSGIACSNVSLPDLKQWIALTSEYEQLKEAGYANDEIYTLLQSSLEVTSTYPSGLKGPRKFKGTHRVVPIDDRSQNLNSRNLDSSSPSVLIIDDSYVSAKLSAKVLCQKFIPIIVDSVESAIQVLAERSDIQMVFLDIVMPNIDGIEYLRQLKSDRKLFKIPVFMLTALEDETLQETCFQLGALDYFLKPLTEVIIDGILVQQRESMKFEVATRLKLQETLEICIDVVVPALRPAPTFKLFDSNFAEVEFPGESSTAGLILAFFPLIHIAVENGSLAAILDDYCHYIKLNCQSKPLPILVITSDLPWVLSSAKQKFCLPCRLLSDPTSIVSETYVGKYNFGRDAAMQSLLDEDSIHPQNSWTASIFGVVRVSPQQEITHRWLALDDRGIPDSGMRPPKMADWFGHSS